MYSFILEIVFTWPALSRNTDVTWMTQAYKTAAFSLEVNFHLNDINRLTQCILRRPDPAKKISFSLTVRKTPKTDKSCFPFEVLIPYFSVNPSRQVN